MIKNENEKTKPKLVSMGIMMGMVFFMLLNQILHVLFSKNLCFIENKLENKFILLFKKDESDDLKTKRSKLNRYLHWFFLHMRDNDVIFPKESTICKETIYYKDINLFLDCYFLDNEKKENL